MKVFAILLTLLCFWKLRRCHGDDIKPYKYLHKYGYISSMSELGSNANGVRKAIEKFQRYAQIPVTGKMDDATKAKLTGPRCGAKDTEPTNIVQGVAMSFRDMRRRKRYVQQGSTWKKTMLTYSVVGYTRPWQKITTSDVQRTLDTAFKMWQAATTLTFKNLGNNNLEADIVIKFSRGSHQDPYPFDGRGGTLAHGFYPGSNQGLSGDIHFDDDEIWTLNGETRTTDFLWTTLHEIGHALGLEHSERREAIMWPWYEGYQSNLKLRKDDVDGIQSIYGQPPPPVTTTQPPDHKLKRSTICGYSNFDAVMYHPATRTTYFFKAYYVWTMDENKIAGNHQLISSKWPGLEGYLDAAYTRRDGYTIFFKGNRYWKYYNFQKIEGPQSLSRFIKNIGDYRDPNKRLDRIDAAMVWDGNAKTYFFRKDQYWRYNEQRREIDRGYPKPLSLWKLVKNPVHDVMSWKKRKTFFFHGNKMYRFDNSKFKLKFKKDKEKQKISYFIKNCRS